MLERLKQILFLGDYTIAVGNPHSDRIFTSHERGVKALLHLLDSDPDMLREASVADKVVGQAAAALMLLGGVRELHSRVITSAAIGMLRKGGVAVNFDVETPFVENRTRTGRCPLDTLCAALSTPDEMAAAIRKFYADLASIQNRPGTTDGSD